MKQQVVMPPIPCLAPTQRTRLPTASGLRCWLHPPMIDSHKKWISSRDPATHQSAHTPAATGRGNRLPRPLNDDHRDGSAQRVAAGESARRPRSAHAASGARSQPAFTTQDLRSGHSYSVASPRGYNPQLRQPRRIATTIRGTRFGWNCKL
jgi:hypothetical protein